jgi:hypothetical protein
MVAVNLGKFMEDVSAYHDLKILSNYYDHKRMSIDASEVTPKEVLSSIDTHAYLEEGYARKYQEVQGKINKLKDSFENEEYAQIVSTVEECISVVDALGFADATNRRDTVYVSRENLASFVESMQDLSYYEYAVNHNLGNTDLLKEYYNAKDQFYDDFSYPVMAKADVEEDYGY